MHLMRWVAAGATVVTVGAVALWAAGPAQAVTGGDDAPPGTYEFALELSMPRIVLSDGTEYASGCSGALVAPRWVITAGHCVHDGDHRRVGGKPPYEIDALIRHSGTGDHIQSDRAVRVVQSPDADVALLELATPVATIRPLAVSTDAPTPGEALVLAGWGSTTGAEDPATRPARLQTAEYAVTRRTPHELYVRATGPERTTSACPYDSGAPYFTVGKQGVPPKLVATEVTGPACPHTEEETTARSDVLARWIRRVTGTG